MWCHSRGPSLHGQACWDPPEMGHLTDCGQFCSVKCELPLCWQGKGGSNVSQFTCWLGGWAVSAVTRTALQRG